MINFHCSDVRLSKSSVNHIKQAKIYPHRRYASHMLNAANNLIAGCDRITKNPPKPRSGSKAVVVALAIIVIRSYSIDKVNNSLQNQG